MVPSLRGAFPMIFPAQHLHLCGISQPSSWFPLYFEAVLEFSSAGVHRQDAVTKPDSLVISFPCFLGSQGGSLMPNLAPGEFVLIFFWRMILDFLIGNDWMISYLGEYWIRLEITQILILDDIGWFIGWWQIRDNPMPAVNMGRGYLRTGTSRGDVERFQWLGRKTNWGKLERLWWFRSLEHHFSH